MGWEVKFSFVVSESASVISLFTFNVSSFIIGKASTELCLLSKSEEISGGISDFLLSAYIFILSNYLTVIKILYISI